MADPGPERAPGWREVLIVAAVVVAVVLGAAFVTGALPAAGQDVVFRTPPHPEPANNMAVEASIAVLPFENLSSDQNAGYFAAGIQDEILTRLTKIGALKVISRTSTSHFASKPFPKL